MTINALRRLDAIAYELAKRPTGCAVCRNQPRVVFLYGEDAEPPPTHCVACGRALQIDRVFRFVMTERPDGPQ
jgi:hypothetical protein